MVSDNPTSGSLNIPPTLFFAFEDRDLAKFLNYPDSNIVHWVLKSVQLFINIFKMLPFTLIYIISLRFWKVNENYFRIGWTKLTRFHYAEAHILVIECCSWNSYPQDSTCSILNWDFSRNANDQMCLFLFCCLSFQKSKERKVNLKMDLQLNTC